jgi:hypothetical protein
VEAISAVTTGEPKRDYYSFTDLWTIEGKSGEDNESLETYLWIVTIGELHEFHAHALTPCMQDAKTLVWQDNDGTGPAATDQYMFWFRRHFHSEHPQRFFRTNSGRFGVSSTAIQPGDRVCVILGHDSPVILRKKTLEKHCNITYQVLGDCYIHGLMNGQAILRRLPHGWQLKVIGHQKIRFTFFNESTGEVTTQDPRLGPLPDEWVEVEKEDETRSEYHIQHYENKETGEVVNSDPRLSPEALKARGVDLEMIVLV